MISTSKLPINQTNTNEDIFRTHEGCEAVIISSAANLRRSVMSTFLGEDSFYEDGQSIQKRIENLIFMNHPETVAEIALEAKEKFLLRKTPLFMARCMLKHKDYRPLVRNLLPKLITRADDILHFMDMYWADGKVPVANSVKKVMDEAFNKFSEVQFGKFQSKERTIKFKDVLFMCHPKPVDEKKKELFSKIAEGMELKSPERWENTIHLANDEKLAWENLIREKKVDNMSLIMNLNKMAGAGVDAELVVEAIRNMNIKGLYPYQFVTASKYAFSLNIKMALETRMMECVAGYEKIPGKTIILVDVSGSMENLISSRSTTSRIDVASAIAMLCKEICEDSIIGTFSDQNVLINEGRGFDLVTLIDKSQRHNGTALMSSIRAFNERFGRSCDRIIVITDEQANHESIADPIQEKAYMINVANEQNGVGYGKWVHIDGFSSAVIDWIIEYEKLIAQYPVGTFAGI